MGKKKTSVEKKWDFRKKVMGFGGPLLIVGGVGAVVAQDAAPAAEQVDFANAQYVNLSLYSVDGSQTNPGNNILASQTGIWKKLSPTDLPAAFQRMTGDENFTYLQRVAFEGDTPSFFKEVVAIESGNQNAFWQKRNGSWQQYWKKPDIHDAYTFPNTNDQTKTPEIDTAIHDAKGLQTEFEAASDSLYNVKTSPDSVMAWVNGYAGTIAKSLTDSLNFEAEIDSGFEGAVNALDFTGAMTYQQLKQALDNSQEIHDDRAALYERNKARSTEVQNIHGQRNQLAQTVANEYVPGTVTLQDSAFVLSAAGDNLDLLMTDYETRIGKLDAVTDSNAINILQNQYNLLHEARNALNKAVIAEETGNALLSGVKKGEGDFKDIQTALNQDYVTRNQYITTAQDKLNQYFGSLDASNQAILESKKKEFTFLQNFTQFITNPTNFGLTVEGGLTLGDRSAGEGGKEKSTRALGSSGYGNVEAAANLGGGFSAGLSYQLSKSGGDKVVHQKTEGSNPPLSVNAGRWSQNQSQFGVKLVGEELVGKFGLNMEYVLEKLKSQRDIPLVGGLVWSNDEANFNTHTIVGGPNFISGDFRAALLAGAALPAKGADNVDKGGFAYDAELEFARNGFEAQLSQSGKGLPFGWGADMKGPAGDVNTSTTEVNASYKIPLIKNILTRIGVNYQHQRRNYGMMNVKDNIVNFYVGLTSALKRK